MCWRLTGDRTDAQDALQEALIAIVRGLPAFDGRSSFATWAYRVATNTCLDELRRRRRRPQPGWPEGALERSPAPEVGDGVVARLEIDAALASLSPEFRAAVVLRDVCGLSYGEIADALDIPPGTVRSRIARARAALIPLLDPAGAGNPHPARQRPSR